MIFGVSKIGNDNVSWHDYYELNDADDDVDGQYSLGEYYFGEYDASNHGSHVSEWERKVMRAIIREDVGRVDTLLNVLLESDGDINDHHASISAAMRRMLGVASVEVRMAVVEVFVEALVKSGGPINATDENGETLLDELIEFGYKDEAEVVLEGLAKSRKSMIDRGGRDLTRLMANVDPDLPDLMMLLAEAATKR